MIDLAVQLEGKARRRRGVGLAALFACAVLFAMIVGNSFRLTNERRAAEAMHVHSLDVLLLAGRLETAANQAIRGQRGYLMTGDRTFLEPYFEGRRLSFDVQRRLRRLTADNPIQQRALDGVERKLEEYFAALDAPIALRAAGRQADAMALAQVRAGRDRVNELLVALDRVEAEERYLLDQRANMSADADARAASYNYVMAAAGLVLFGLVAWAVLGAAVAQHRALALTAELQRLATTDMLTGLPNRRQIVTALDREIARAGRTGRTLALALLDIDRFKAINDTHGHPAGDMVLQAVADELRSSTRGNDLLGRFGGEEFAILMPETSIDQAHLVCERLRKAVARRALHYPDGSTGHVTVSTGVALLAGGEACAQLVSRADGALYQAKEDGRDLVRLAA